MKAKYHQDADTAVTLDVLTDHKDGTVDLGREREVLVSRCPVGDAGKPGTATLIKSPPKTKNGKQPTADEKAKALADAEAALNDAKEAFAADPANADLGKRVDELRAVIEELQG